MLFVHRCMEKVHNTGYHVTCKRAHHAQSTSQDVMVYGHASVSYTDQTDLNLRLHTHSHTHTCLHKVKFISGICPVE